MIIIVPLFHMSSKPLSSQWQGYDTKSAGPSLLCRCAELRPEEGGSPSTQSEGLQLVNIQRAIENVAHVRVEFPIV